MHSSNDWCDGEAVWSLCVAAEHSIERQKASAGGHAGDQLNCYMHGFHLPSLLARIYLTHEFEKLVCVKDF